MLLMKIVSWTWASFCVASTLFALVMRRRALNLGATAVRLQRAEADGIPDRLVRAHVRQCDLWHEAKTWKDVFPLLCAHLVAAPFVVAILWDAYELEWATGKRWVRRAIDRALSTEVDR